jgi:hypothetical protein
MQRLEIVPVYLIKHKPKVMKKIFSFSLILLLVISVNSSILAQTKMTLDLPAFTEIELDINASVTIKQGKSQSVEITGPQELIDVLNKEVKGDKWEIKYTKRKVDTKKSLQISITVVELTEVDVNGSGDVRGDNAFHGTKMELSINGSGYIQLELYVEDLELDINGSGDLKLSGSAEELEVSINGSGDVKCPDLTSENAEFDINGSGDSEIHVTKKLNVEINGSGDIHYSGNPSMKVNKNGSGNLKSVDDK